MYARLLLTLRHAVQYYVNKTSPLEDGPVFIDELNCFGNESDINNCSFKTPGNCNHDDDLFLNCAGSFIKFSAFFWSYIKTRHQVNIVIFTPM